MGKRHDDQTAWELRQNERESRWRKHLEAWRDGGRSQAEYCRQHGLSPVDFSWWKHELLRRDRERAGVRPPPAKSTPAFVPLTLQTACVAEVHACEVLLRNGRRLRIGTGVSPRWVAELAATLEQEPQPC